MDTQKTDWHIRYSTLAAHISTWSKDPSRKIGAVVVGDHGQILSTGYNGFPRGIEDSEERLNDRETKYAHTVHAEMNCIYNASLTGTSLKGSTLYVYGLPVCSSCCLGIIQAGIIRVYAVVFDTVPEKWKESGELTTKLFEEAGIEYNILVVQDPSNGN